MNAANINIAIRSLEAEDVEKTIALWKRAGVYREWNEPYRDIAKALDGEHSTILLGLLGDEIVASVMCGEDGHRGWVYYMAVDPSFQGGGYGRAVLDAAEEWLAKRGIWKVQLLVRNSNAAVVEFYGKQGYVDTESVCLQKIIEPIS